jgi:uncharacterized protein YeeX (DUF496 family)
MPNKHDKFVELAEKRVKKLLKQIELVGNLSNRSNYSYSDEDVKTIFSTIRSKVKEAESRFTTSKDKEFKLK